MRKSSLIGAAVVGIMAASVSATAGWIKCEGGNACSHQGGCKNPKMAKKNAVSECKGQGFTMEKTKAACDAAKAANASGMTPPPEAPKG